jgi:hypothetical protein
MASPPIRWLPLDYSRHAIREIFINGLKVPPPEIQIGDVHRSEYLHDMFVFQMVWPDVRTLTDASGWPVYCRFGVTAQQGYFYGYVQTAGIVESRANSSSQQRIVQFTCLGATSTMQGGSPRSFPGMSADNVAKSIVTPYHLALVADHHDFLFAALVQARESDWQFLVKLARSVGYMVTSSKVTIFFIDPLKVVQNTGSAVPVTAMESERNNPVVVGGVVTVGAKNNISEFNHTVVQSVDALGTPVYASGTYDQRLSLLGANTVQPTVLRYDPDQQPLDAKHAQVIADSNNRPEKWPLQTQLFCKGDGRIRPGVVASLRIGQNNVSGLWLVRSVVHHLGRDSYTMDLQLARDATTNSPYPTPTITAGNRSGPLNSVAAPMMTNGKWTSIWSA